MTRSYLTLKCFTIKLIRNTNYMSSIYKGSAFRFFKKESKKSYKPTECETLMKV